jgi:hypothetical protein
MNKNPDIDKLLADLEYSPLPGMHDRVLNGLHAARDETAAKRKAATRARALIGQVARIAAVIALPAGLFLLVWQIMSWQSRSLPADGSAKIAHRENQGETQSLENQDPLSVVQSYYDKRNIGGLLKFLATGPAERQARIARMLGEIGDASAIGPLQALSDAWKGEPDENPFQAAITQIESRIERPPLPPEKAAIPKDSVDAAPAETAVIVGQVIDETNRQTIEGAWASLPEPDPKQNVECDGQGNFRISGLAFGVDW